MLHCPVRGRHAVIIGKGNERCARGANSGITRGGQSSIGRQVNHLTCAGISNSTGGVSRTVIHHHDLESLALIEVREGR
jgi:hypothetical protein